MDQTSEQRGKPDRKWTSYQRRNGIHLALLLWTTVLMQTCNGYDMKAVDVSNTSYYQELTRQNVLVVDELHMPMAHSQHLEQKRSSSNGTTSAGGSVPSLNTDTGLPVPFDTSIGSNFTDPACPQYFSKFLADPTFQSCLPMSLLLQNSMSFFQAARSKELLTQTLDKSCSASLAVCSPLMSQYATELISSAYCQKDYLQQNPLVMQAYAGLNAYEPMYKATCLKANTTGDYCFVDAMETSSADDSYPYYTAVGLQLPTGSKPACSSCLRDTMEIFSGYALQTSQSLSQTYLLCAIQVNQQCGESFASTQVKSASKVQTTNTGSQARSGKLFLFASIAIAILIV